MTDFVYPRRTQPVKKIIFMGSPAFAVPSLQALQKTFEITAVYCQPPRPAGRGQQLQPTPIQVAAEEFGLPIFHPEKLRGEALEKLLAVDADVICVVAYGLLLPRALVEQKVCLNVHPSSLPRWRGAAPLNHTLLAGDATTEVCVMQLDAGMDTGPVFKRAALPLTRQTTLGGLAATASHTGATLLLAVLQNLPTLQALPQIGEATHAAKFTSADRQLNWSHPAAQIHDRIRAFAPAPGAFFRHADEQVKVLASTELTPVEKSALSPGAIQSMDETHGVVVIGGNGLPLQLTTLQRPGRTAQPALEVLRSLNLAPGQLLG